MHIRIKNGLLPCFSASLLCHNGSDYINQLGKACHFYPIRMLQKSNQHQAHEKGVFKAVHILQQGRRHMPGMIFHKIIIRVCRMEPYVPLVKAQIHFLFTALLCLYVVADRDHRADKVIHIVGQSQKICRVIVLVAIILMQGNVVHLVIRVTQGGRLPFREGGHFTVRASAGNQLNGRINQLHSLCCFLCQPPIFIHRLVAQLPGTVHLIAQAPYLDIMGLLHSMADTHIAVLRPGRMVAVFQEVTGVGNSPGAQVDCHHHIRACLFRPF